ncbi:MAG TPA: DHA2 family efflux MFS transporter permease subunit, partial [Spirochaetota bacterium]
MRVHADKRSPGYRWTVMVILIIGTFMSSLNTSVVNVSLPAIMADFGSNLDDVSWVITAYMIALAALMPITAWLRDHIGYKKIFIASLTVFTVGSFLCGMSWSLSTLIGARILQALGGGAIVPSAMAMLTELFDKNERGKAMGIWGMSAMLGPAIGPTVGGYLTNIFGWRSIFLINLPIGIIAVAMTIRFLLKDQIVHAHKKKFDAWGFLFFSGFLVPFLIATSKGQRLGWSSTFIISCFALSVLCFVGFILVESHITYRIIDLTLFRSKIFSICMFLSAMRSIALFGGMFLLPLLIQQQLGYDEIDSGLILMPGSVFLALCMPLGGKLVDSFGAKIPSAIGVICLGIFMFMYHNVDVTTPVILIIIPTLVRGMGLSLLMAPLTTAAVNALPTHKAGMASSMLNIIQQIGGSIGIVIFGTVLTNRATYHLSVVGESMKNSSPALAESLREMLLHVHSLGLTYSQSGSVAHMLLVKHIAQSAIIIS